MINASQRILSRSRVEKDPVTPEILQALVISNIKDKFPSLSDLRPVALYPIGYAGFFRFSELRHIEACNVKSSPRMFLFSKNLLRRSTNSEMGRGSLSLGQTFRPVLSRLKRALHISFTN